MDMGVLECFTRVNKCLLGHQHFVSTCIFHTGMSQGRDKPMLMALGSPARLEYLSTSVQILLTCACKYILGQLRCGQSIGV